MHFVPICNVNILSDNVFINQTIHKSKQFNLIWNINGLKANVFSWDGVMVNKLD